MIDEHLIAELHNLKNAAVLYKKEDCLKTFAKKQAVCHINLDYIVNDMNKITNGN